MKKLAPITIVIAVLLVCLVGTALGDAEAPTVVTEDVSPVTWDFAILRGTSNPNNLSTTAYFEYGSDTNYGSVCPTKIPTEDANWILEVKVRNQTGTKGGKLSIQRPNNQWDTVEFGSTADGVYQNTYSGVIKRIDVGANGETGFEMDVEYYSLRKVDSNIITYEGDTVEYNGKVVTYDA